MCACVRACVRACVIIIIIIIIIKQTDTCAIIVKKKLKNKDFYFCVVVHSFVVTSTLI